MSAIHDAAKAGDVGKVRSLLGGGLLRRPVDVNALDDEFGGAPLHWAAFYGHLDVVKVLLEHGANINAQSRGGATPAAKSAEAAWFEPRERARHLEVLRLLVGRGAAIAGLQPDAENRFRHDTGLGDALCQELVGLVAPLLGKGTAPTATSESGDMPPLTFLPQQAPPMFLRISRDLFEHLVGAYSFRESPWDYLEYDAHLLRTGMPSGQISDQEFRPGSTQPTRELDVRASQGLLAGKSYAGKPFTAYSYCLARDREDGYWASAQDDYSACSRDTVWNLTVTLISLSSGGGHLIPDRP